MLLEPRSLLVLSDSSRYDWKHGIAARKAHIYGGNKIIRQRRISMTLVH